MSTVANENKPSGLLSNKFVKWGMPIAAVGIFAVTGIIESGASADREAKLSSQQSQIASLKGDIDVKNLERETKAKKMNSEVAGLSSARQDGDEKAIRRVLEDSMNWDSYAEYTAAREKLKKEQGMSEDSQFLKTFMPKVGNLQDRAGNNYNEIDTNGLNMKLKGFSSSVTKVAGTKYTYIGLASVKTSNKANRGSAVTYSVVEYTTDANHKLTKLNAYPIRKAPSIVGSMKSSAEV